MISSLVQKLLVQGPICAGKCHLHATTSVMQYLDFCEGIYIDRYLILAEKNIFLIFFFIHYSMKFISVSIWRTFQCAFCVIFINNLPVFSRNCNFGFRSFILTSTVFTNTVLNSSDYQNSCVYARTVFQ